MKAPSRVHGIIVAAFLAVLVTKAWGIEQRVQLKTSTGTLYGTLDLPNGTPPHPVVISIAGSGPTDRDGNQTQMNNDSLKQPGQGLAARGIAALRYDKRGVQKAPVLRPGRKTSALKPTSPTSSSGLAGSARTPFLTCQPYRSQ